MHCTEKKSISRFRNIRRLQTKQSLLRFWIMLKKDDRKAKKSVPTTALKMQEKACIFYKNNDFGIDIPNYGEKRFKPFLVPTVLKSALKCTISSWIISFYDIIIYKKITQKIVIILGNRLGNREGKWNKSMWTLDSDRLSIIINLFLHRKTDVVIIIKDARHTLNRFLLSNVWERDLMALPNSVKRSC